VCSSAWRGSMVWYVHVVINHNYYYCHHNNNINNNYHYDHHHKQRLEVEGSVARVGGHERHGEGGGAEAHGELEPEAVRP